MIGILIVAHGGLAREYRSAMEHIIGLSPAILAIEILPTDNANEKEKQISERIEELDDGDGVVVVTDMHGSTPANISIKACAGYRARVIFGANLPLLLKLVKVRNLSIDMAVSLAVESGRRYIDAKETNLDQI